MAAPASTIAVHKFGGAALANAAAITNVGDILAESAGQARLVVTSALQGVTNALLAAMGYAPRHTFEDGLAETVAWYRDNRAWWEPLKAGR